MNDSGVIACSFIALKEPSVWNVTLVLKSLTSTLFVPLKQSSDRHLTFKMYFLLALASPKRVGELHNLYMRYDILGLCLHTPFFLSYQSLLQNFMAL